MNKKSNNLKKNKQLRVEILSWILLMCYVLPIMFNVVDPTTIINGHGPISIFYEVINALVFPFAFVLVTIATIERTGIASKILKNKRGEESYESVYEEINNDNYKDRIQPYYIEALGTIITMSIMYIFIFILFVRLNLGVVTLIFLLLGTSSFLIIPFLKRDFMAIIDNRKNRIEKKTVKLINIKPYVTFANAHFENYKSYYRDTSLGRYVLELSALSEDKENTMYMYLSIDEVQLLKGENSIYIEYFTKAKVIYKITEVRK